MLAGTVAWRQGKTAVWDAAFDLRKQQPYVRTTRLLYIYIWVFTFTAKQAQNKNTHLKFAYILNMHNFFTCYYSLDNIL